jgi:protein-L-isoaspartate(D-aspartate) O-methyltransferase
MNIITLFSGTGLNRTLVLLCAAAAGAFLYLFAPAAHFPRPAGIDPETAARQRAEMVERQLRQRGIRDERVLAAMGALPRHLFVPERQRPSAYEDRPLPIGDGQTISQPYIVAVMTELLELDGREKILEIGTGSGYQTALLAGLASQVYSVEIVAGLADRAKKVLTDLGYRNVELKVGDGFYGWEEKAPFDAILVTAAAPRIPELLWRQLKEKGRLVMPLGEPSGRDQKLIRATKSAGQPVIENFSAVLFVPMTGAIEDRRR